jgi:choline dehydrogenase-like flavoprotein
MSARDHDVADVLIVGSGATGAIAAMVLGQAGLKVVCLEQGGWIEERDHPHASGDWQWQRRTRWSPDVNVRRGNRDDFPVRSNSSQVLMWNGVGGSTNVYGALWPRYRPSDFRKGQEHGLAPDWPITYEDLAPYYERADRIVGVSGLAGDPSMPSQDAYPTPPVPLGAASRRLSRAFDRLGWHWWPVPAGVISQDYDGRPGCHGCGICNGCPRGSMSKFSLSVWPRALEAGVDLRTHARVIRIEQGRDGRATGVEYVDRNTGRRHFQRAEIVILAANGVGTPRLLLASGLANSSDQVGRNLLHHTLVACEMWVDEPLASHTSYVAALISREFAETDVSRGFVNGFNFNCVTTGGAGEQANGFLSNARAPWGRDHHKWFARHFGRGFGVFGIGDDLPNPENRITLSDTERDEDGVPVARLHYLPGENDRRMMRFMLDRLVEIAKAADAFEYRLQDYTDEKGVYRTPAWHLLGTCRMGKSPEMSVVNKHHQCWDVPNLFIIDGSVFTTGGVVNPTPTVSALALRAAEHIRDNFRDLARATRPVLDRAA